MTSPHGDPVGSGGVEPGDVWGVARWFAVGPRDFGWALRELLAEMTPTRLNWLHPWNLPGPFHVGASNLSSLGSLTAPGAEEFIQYHKGEFIWNQPGSIRDAEALAVAGLRDETSSYGVTGLMIWTPPAVRSWWADRAQIVAWIRDRLARTSHNPAEWRRGARDCEHHLVLKQHLALLEGGAVQYLRRFMYFLDHWRHAPTSAALPDL